MTRRTTHSQRPRRPWRAQPHLPTSLPLASRGGVGLGASPFGGTSGPAPAVDAEGALHARLRSLEAENRSLRADVERLARYRELAHHDPLTGLPNRRAFEARLYEETERGRRYGVPYGVLVMDLDGFKALNDEEGHAAGDRALVTVGRLVRGAVRTHDVVFRLGGDELAALLPRAGAEGTALVAARVAARIERAQATGSIRVGLSIGAASWPSERTTSSDLVALADRRMYANKRRRRGAR